MCLHFQIKSIKIKLKIPTYRPSLQTNDGLKTELDFKMRTQTVNGCPNPCRIP